MWCFVSTDLLQQLHSTNGKIMTPEILALDQKRDETDWKEWRRYQDNRDFVCQSKQHVMLSLCTPWRDICSSGGITLLVLNHGTRWKWVFKFMFPPLTPIGKNGRYSLSRRLARSQPGPSCCGEERNFVGTSRDTKFFYSCTVHFDNISN